MNVIIHLEATETPDDLTALNIANALTKNPSLSNLMLDEISRYLAIYCRYRDKEKEIRDDRGSKISSY